MTFYVHIDLISLYRLEVFVKALHTTPAILVDVVIIVITPVATPVSVEMVSNMIQETSMGVRTVTD